MALAIIAIVININMVNNMVIGIMFKYLRTLKRDDSCDCENVMIMYRWLYDEEIRLKNCLID